MDSQALSDLHAELTRAGYSADLTDLRCALLQAEEDTEVRAALSQWGPLATPDQHQALTKALAHVRKHRQTITTHSRTHQASLETSLVFSRPCEFRGVELGKLVVSKSHILWKFYRGNVLRKELVTRLSGKSTG